MMGHNAAKACPTYSHKSDGKLFRNNQMKWKIVLQYLLKILNIIMTINLNSRYIAALLGHMSGYLHCLKGV